MRISVLTPTYNRINLLERLYASLVQNSNFGIEIEWLIIDDGSTISPKEIIDRFILENKIIIKYFEQENKGKMEAINFLVQKATGDLIVECDDDDYFTENAFEIIKSTYEKNINTNDCYAMCFLKYNQNKENMGKKFQKEKTTMFDLYFKQGEDGEKALVFFSEIRKKYKHELVNGEKFVTEARMYNAMDKKYNIVCFNSPIMICEYLPEGYSNNMNKLFSSNPFGYYEYFKELLQFNMKGVLFKKRLYIIKHYLLFSNLTKQKHILKPVNNLLNKIFIIVLWLPGKLKTNIWEKKL